MPKKTLIFKFGALGDVIMATPLIKAITDSQKSSNYTLVTTKPFIMIFENWNNLKIKTIDNTSILENLKFVLDIRKTHYSQLFDLQSNDRSRIICLLSGIKNSVGNHRFPYRHHPAERWEGQTHIFDRMCKVVEQRGIKVKDKSPLLLAAEKQKVKVGKWIAQNLETKKPFVLLHAGSSRSRPEKRWPYFQQLAHRLNSDGFGIVWIGGPDDTALNDRLASAVGIDATDSFTILELAELGRKANFAVTNDSGPMHILSASGIPIFGLFGPSSKQKNHALGQEHRALAVVENWNTSLRPSQTSLSNLSLDSVINKISEDGLLA